MGDGMWGLAVAILGGMVLIMAVAIGIGVWLGRRLGSMAGVGWKWPVFAGTVALSTLIGVGVVVATFMEDTWSPPDDIVFALPPGFAPPSVMLMEDPTVSAEMPWRGSNKWPLMHRTAELAVPTNGVVRVRTLGFGEVIQHPRMRLADGRSVDSALTVHDVPGVSPGMVLVAIVREGGEPFDSGTDIKAWVAREAARRTAR